ncbi:hypothetical protein SAMN05444817_102184 [Corynebacterium appendicis CIP 107643]|uniref:Tetratricopeptide repeat-containing protein n=1 Tax=Corynebacterium appendicis CIP 107643 TaxID=1161099 RepID=A0A1N7IW50_9CORY|nr:hypothetical protein [Corynebacterium appendicis]MDK8624960.1 hypothetical protein [Corynebacterium appendicis]WJY61064.1 hypothetical protein CAPP_05715 [Corynebacterium appendicis CIP 107643]SIS41274.1 hypothetical protein SAMN05444817_102184 [Corynebacterium appendicis CIP 107643]
MSYDNRDRNDRRNNRGNRNNDRRGYGRDRDNERNYRGRDGERGDRRYGDRRDDRRGGNKVRHDRSNPYRQGFREDRMAQKENEPAIPDDIDVADLDPSVLQDLRVLAKDNADRVAKHMIMAATWMADDPQLALTHARAAKNRAGRVGVVREAAGIAAYHAGEWKEALSELRAARRMSGGPGLLAVMADAERGLGRPEKALEIGRSPEVRDLDDDSKIELAIVMAGARHDMGQHESALATLQQLNPTMKGDSFEHIRLAYAYADALAQVGRTDEARTWFEHVAKVDTDKLTDAADRLKELK